MSKETQELLPCPFCGANAAIEPWHGGKRTKKMISCSNAEGENYCEVRPMVTGETKAGAIRNWNTRATKPEAVRGDSGVEVCEECDSMGCTHIRNRNGNFSPASTGIPGYIHLTSAANSLIGYVESLSMDLGITQPYLDRLHGHYIPKLKEALNSKIHYDAKPTGTEGARSGGGDVERLAAHFASYRDRWSGRQIGHTKIEPCDRIAAQNAVTSLPQPTPQVKWPSEARDE